MDTIDRIGSQSSFFYNPYSSEITKMPYSFLKKNWAFIFPWIAFFSDIFFLNLSFYIALHLRYPGGIGLLSNYAHPWIAANIVFVPIVICLGLYRGIFKMSLESQKNHIEQLTFYMAIFLMAYLYIIKGNEYSRGVVIIFLLAVYVILELNHSILSKINIYLVHKGLGSRNTIIVGIDGSARDFERQLKDIYGDFYKVKGFVKNDYPFSGESKVENIIGTANDIESILYNNKIEQIFIVSDSMDISKYSKIRKEAEKHGVYVKMVGPCIRNLIKKRKIKDITGVPLTVDHLRPRYNYWAARLKRFFDCTLLLAGSIVIVPVCLIVSAFIKLTSPGPVFFNQRRALYKGGPEFWFHKFRSMYVDAEERKEELLGDNETNGALFKIKNDPRVTPIGKIIRKFSLDEFPQFINVFKGEMSIVGPRPLPIKDFDMLKDGENKDNICYEWYKKRGDAKAGITGLWQVSGRSGLSFEEMCMLDLYYIENQSVFFDLEIIFETVFVMLFGSDAY